MSKIAILTDIHANLPALEAVLREAEESGVDEIVFGGDLIGYGACPRQCVERVRRTGGRSVMGNHDEFTRWVAARDEDSLPAGWEGNPVWAGIVLAVRELDPGDLEWLWSLPREMELAGGAILAHASLHEPENWHYLTSEADAAPTLAILREGRRGIGFFGHTHQVQCFADRSAPAQPARREGGRIHLPEGAVCALTVGSVGQPRERHDHRATWAIWDPDSRVVEIRHTPYPSLEAAQAIVRAGLPLDSALRLLTVEERLRWLSR